jgi:hypothetical protein
VETFQVRQLNSPRLVQLVAPELNFFALVEEDVLSGARTRYYNITRGAQDLNLFSPPEGVAVVPHLHPMGIINDGSEVPSLKDIRAEHKAN